MKSFLICILSVCVVITHTESVSFSSSSQSSSKKEESSSGDSYHVKVEEFESKTDSEGTHEVTKVHETNKPAGGNETSSSRTVEVIRHPNGTIERKVKNNGPGMKAECAKKEDCPDNKFCSKFSYQCQDCIQDAGCFGDDQCCGDKVCCLGRCKVKPEYSGLDRSPCDGDSDCKTGLFCSQNVFDGGLCKKLKMEGQSCNRGLFGSNPKCAEGLECKRSGGFPFFFSNKCLKEGSVQTKSWINESPFGWFNAKSIFDEE